jgi:hypothetical protein
MFSKMTQAVMLSGCLLAAGAVSANERNVIVPVIAGAAVGAVLATLIARSDHNDHNDRYRPRYDHSPPPAHYRPQYQPVRYVPVAPRMEYRRFDAPPPRGFQARGRDHDRGYERGHDRGDDYGRGGNRW